MQVRIKYKLAAAADQEPEKLPAACKWRILTGDAAIKLYNGIMSNLGLDHLIEP